MTPIKRGTARRLGIGHPLRHYRRRWILGSDGSSPDNVAFIPAEDSAAWQNGSHLSPEQCGNTWSFLDTAATLTPIPADDGDRLAAMQQAITKFTRLMSEQVGISHEQLHTGPTMADVLRSHTPRQWLTDQASKSTTDRHTE